MINDNYDIYDNLDFSIMKYNGEMPNMEELFDCTNIDGQTFKSMCGTNFFVITDESDENNNNQLIDGYNESEYEEYFTFSMWGGIEFINETFLFHLIGDDETSKYCRKLIIPDDANIYIESDRFKTNKAYLESKMDIAKLRKANNTFYSGFVSKKE